MEFDENKLAALFSDKSKRKGLTNRQQIYFWENPRQYARTCSICNQRITRIPDVEIDRKSEFSKSSNSLALTHKECNKVLIKSNK